LDVNYLGYLSKEDPLYSFICRKILPKVGQDGEKCFKVFQFSSSNNVYLYLDEATDLKLIGKFFGGQGVSKEDSVHRMEMEYRNLHLLRGYGFCRHPYYVPEPLGQCASINQVLVEEFCPGVLLTEFLVRAIFRGEEDALLVILTALAHFLARLHNHADVEKHVDFIPECRYFNKILLHLKRSFIVDEHEARELSRLVDSWRSEAVMWEDIQVLVHGDATPPNFLFRDDQSVVGIDFERMKSADRVFDLGRVTGELKHFYMQYGRDKCRAEPFIRHFLLEYAGHLPDSDYAFQSITRRLPFYMGLNELRIARNKWLGFDYRKELVSEAKLTLSTGLENNLR